MKRAIVLAGGGAKGSYEFGFWRAIKELNIDFQIVTGSSVGALNGALMASGLYESGMEMWNNITTADVVKASPTKISQMIDTEGITSSLKMFLGDLSETAVNLHLDPFPLEGLIAKYLDEKLLRESKIEFGLMVAEYPNMKIHPVMLKEIPYGMLSDYLLASSAVYPSMEPKEIAGKRYVDGGYCDNMPINLALDMGAKDIIAVELGASGIEASYQTDYPVRIIRPHFDLGPTMEFVPEIAKRNLALGYNDTMKSFGKFDGKVFTFELGENEKMQKHFENFCIEALIKCTALSLSEKGEYHRSLAVKGLCEKQNHRVGLMKRDLALVCAETAAKLFEVDPTKVYSEESFGEAILEKAAAFIENEENPAFEIFKSPKSLTYKLAQLEKLDKKDVAGYIFHLWKELFAAENPGRDLRSLCRFAPTEFFAALYICFLKENEK